MKNWQTSLAGLFILLGVLGKDMQKGSIDPASDFVAASAAIGLIAAKDRNVTGGTVQQ